MALEMQMNGVDVTRTPLNHFAFRRFKLATIIPTGPLLGPAIIQSIHTTMFGFMQEKMDVMVGVR